MNLKFNLTTLVGLAALSVAPSFAATYSVSATGTNGNNPLSATASFVLNAAGTGLTITVTNNAAAPAPPATWANSDLLHGIFFGSSALAFTPGSATSTSMFDVTTDTFFSTTTTINGQTVTCASGVCNVDAGWGAYNTSYAGFANTLTSAGYGSPFTGSSNFSTGSGTALDGTNYGIASSNLTSSGQQGFNGGQAPQAVSVGSVVFTFSGLSLGANLTDAELANIIGVVGFQYGTALTDKLITSVPEPGFYGLLSLGLSGMIFAIRRRRMA
jgi:hypothetical protein